VGSSLTPEKHAQLKSTNSSYEAHTIKLLESDILTCAPIAHGAALCGTKGSTFSTLHDGK